MRHLKGGLRLWLDAVGPMLGLSAVVIPIGVALSPVLFGLLALNFAFPIMWRSLVQAGRERQGTPAPEPRRKSLAGALTMLGLAAFTGAVLLIGLAVEHALEPGPLRLPLALAAGLVGSVAVGVAFAPLLFAPVFASHGVRGPLRPFSASFELAARMGPAQSMRLGAVAGGMLGIALVGVAGLFLEGAVTPVSLFFAAPLAVGLGAPVAASAIAHAFASYERDEETDERPVTARLRGVWGLIAPALMALFGAMAFAAFTPTTLHPSASRVELQRGFHGVGIQTGEQWVALPNTSVAAHTIDNGISIEAADGGGAGPIEAGFATPEVGVFVLERDTSPVTFEVVVTNGEDWGSTIVDADGVRLDDGFGPRVFGRLGDAGRLALGLGLLSLLFIAFSLGSELGTARALDVPKLETAGRSGELVALEGVLRVAEDSEVVFEPGSAPSRLVSHAASGKLRVMGEAWVEADAGAIRLRLPDTPVPVLEGSQSWSGEHVVVLSRFRSLGTTGLRTSSVPWPEDGMLTLGQRRDASGALVARAVRRASFVALPTLLLLGGAAARLVYAAL